MNVAHCLLLVVSVSFVLQAFGWNGVRIPKFPLMKFQQSTLETTFPYRAIDPSKSWDVIFRYQGEEKTVKVCENQVLLEAAEDADLEPPYGCRQGACCACVAKVRQMQCIYQRNFNIYNYRLSKGNTIFCKTQIFSGPIP